MHLLGVFVSIANWNIGRTNQEFAGCCLQMTLRDFGRFGQFMPDDWLQMATQTQVKLWPTIITFDKVRY